MSTIKVDTIKNTSNVEVFTAKAWVNFDGTQTAANMIRASGNVSSITDNGTGDYTVNFTTSMSDINYSAAMYVANSESASAAAARNTGNCQKLTTGFRFIAGYPTSNGGLVAQDQASINVAVFR